MTRTPTKAAAMAAAMVVGRTAGRTAERTAERRRWTPTEMGTPPSRPGPLTSNWRRSRTMSVSGESLAPGLEPEVAVKERSPLASDGAPAASSSRWDDTGPQPNTMDNGRSRVRKLDPVRFAGQTRALPPGTLGKRPVQRVATAWPEMVYGPMTRPMAIAALRVEGRSRQSGQKPTTFAPWVAIPEVALPEYSLACPPSPPSTPRAPSPMLR